MSHNSSDGISDNHEDIVSSSQYDECETPIRQTYQPLVPPATPNCLVSSTTSISNTSRNFDFEADEDIDSTTNDPLQEYGSSISYSSYQSNQPLSDYFEPSSSHQITLREVSHYVPSPGSNDNSFANNHSELENTEVSRNVIPIQEEQLQPQIEESHEVLRPLNCNNLQQNSNLNIEQNQSYINSPVILSPNIFSVSSGFQNLDQSSNSNELGEYVSQNAHSSSLNCEVIVDPESEQNLSEHLDGSEIVISNVPVESRARASLPSSYLYIQQINEGTNEYGVFAKKSIPHRTQFGPVEGIIREYNSKKLGSQPNLVVYVNSHTFLDQSDENNSNWMRFVRSAESSEKQNLTLVAKEGGMIENCGTELSSSKFYFITTRAINEGEELKVWYSWEYIQSYKLGFLLSDSYLRSHEIKKSESSTSKSPETIGNKLKNKGQYFSTILEKVPLAESKSGENELNKEYKCYCGKGFQSFFHLKRHKLKHGDEKRFRCRICLLTFSSLYIKNRHLKQHSINAKRMKFTYYRDSENRLNITKSNKSKNMKEGTVDTAACNTNNANNNVSTLKEYMNQEDRSENSKSFTRFINNEQKNMEKISYDIRIESVKPHSSQSLPKVQKFGCAICSETFDSLKSRNSHITTHADPITGFYKCVSCSKQFEDFSMYRKHLRTFHSNKIFPCSQCEKTFTRTDKLKLHMLRHSDHREFLCQNCGKQFKRKDKLKEHIIRMHGTEKGKQIKTLKASTNKKFTPKVSPEDYNRFIYKCHTCLLGFKRRGMLVNHLAKKHPDIPLKSVPELNLPILRTTRNYYCQYCDKIYKSSSKRKAHILKNHPGKDLPLSNRHKGGIPFIPGVPNPTFSAAVGSISISPHYCDWCHKQYASRAKLLQHQRKRHSQELEKDLKSKEQSKLDSRKTLNVNHSLESLDSDEGIITLLGMADHKTSNELSHLFENNTTASNDLLTQAMSELTSKGIEGLDGISIEGDW